VAAAAAAAAVVVVVDSQVQQAGVQDQGSTRLLMPQAVVVAAGRKVGSAAQVASRGRREGQIGRLNLLAVVVAVGAEQEPRSLEVNHKQHRLEEEDHKKPE